LNIRTTISRFSFYLFIWCCYVSIVFGQGLYSNQQENIHDLTGKTFSNYYSADGDTLYINDDIIIRSKSNTSSNNQTAAAGTALDDVFRTSWGEEMRLTYFVDSSTTINSNNFFCVKQDTLFLTFAVRNSGIDTVRTILMASFDNGNTWSDPIGISMLNWRSSSATLIHYNDGILVVSGFGTQDVWRNVYAKRSFDLGNTWTNQFIFWDYPQPALWGRPGTAKGDSIFVLVQWEYNDDEEAIDSTYIIRSFNMGESWSDRIQGFWSPLDSYFNTCYTQGRLQLIHQEYIQELHLDEVSYRYSDDLGQCWSENIPISDMGIEPSQWPYISGDDAGNLIISWFDYKYGSGSGGWAGDILFRISDDNGNTWGPETRLTTESNSTQSSSFIDGDHIGIVWTDHRTGLFRPELYYSESFDGGVTWSAELRLTDAPNYSGYAAIQKHNGIVYLFWQDARHGDLFSYEEYFRRGEIITGINEPALEPGDNLINLYPNPFNSQITIKKENMEGGDINCEIYDLTGKLIRSIKGGLANISWDGTDEFGQKVSSGIYFLKVSNPDNVVIRKITFLK